MEFTKVVAERYSCKNFSTRKVEAEKLTEILEAGRLAPTAKNFQEQRIYVLQSEESLAKLDKVTPCRYGAPTCLVVAFDKNSVFTYPGGKRDSGVEDAAIVATHLMLAAANAGVDSCWLNFFDPDELAKELGRWQTTARESPCPRRSHTCNTKKHPEMLPGVFALLSDDTPVFGLVVIGGHAVVGIHPVGRRQAVGREAPEGEGRIVQLGGVGGGLCHLPDVGLRLVAEAALGQTKRPLGRDIAGADELPEFLCDLCRCRGCDEVERIVRLCRGEAEGVVAGV